MLPRRALSLGVPLLAAQLTSPAGGGPAAAQEEDPWKVSPERIERARTAPLFRSTEPLELTLTAPFSVIRKEDRGDDAPDRPATLTFRSADGSERTLQVDLHTRGNWRRQKRNCDFPPLWIDLKADDPALAGTALEGQNRLKLYVTCRPGRDEYEQYILQEYLVYPTYNLLTDESFRARLARVRYEDVDDPEESFTRWAFVLEHKDDMSARNEAVPVESPQVHPATMQPEKTALVEVFNYMIGMTDWSAAFRHNIEVIRRMDGSIVPVAYDFDWSGIVDTRYAEPAPQLEIRSVRERRYQGYCRETDYEALFQRFLDRREEILALWSGFELVEPKRRERAVEFLEGFFDRIADRSGRERVLRECVPLPG